MDINILYVILAIGVAFGISYLVSYLRRKKMLKQEDLLFAIKALDLSLKVVSEMHLNKEKEIKKISQIVIDSLEYGVSYFNDEQDVLQDATEYAYELCGELNVELTDSRKTLIQELIKLVFNDKYIERISK